MTPRRLPWPRSLAGQMALLVALALFVAQAINLALLLRERSSFRVAQASRPAAFRLADAIDQEASGRRIAPDRGRVRVAARSPITADMDPQPEMAREIRTQLDEFGVRMRRVEVAIAPPGTYKVPLSRFERRMAARHGPEPLPESIVIAAQQPGGRWLVLAGGLPRGDTRLFWRLLAQTLILYGMVLLPVLWVARRISRPLRELAAAARAYSPRTPPRALEEDGPPDVAAVIAAFNALSLRVTAMLDEKDRMLGAIGHDLRTPLAALRVRIESVEDEQDRARMADTIAEMNRTLEDILSLARLGRPSEPETEVDLAALVDAVVEDFRDLGDDVTFEEAERLRMRLRPSLIRRAVRNLIENAVKYAGAAEVSLRAEAASAAIVVADRGPGIPADRLDDVFGAFIRLETSRNRETGGIGLGLALARAIVEEAGGAIVLAAREGGGLVATITLPRG
ncbi:HAMP domain-containing sensor histidine kinase [Sphingomonas sp. BK235]|uniref:sensor histidine kinase n=1 Tax=Sphingomonas sp. BK235 TaxID=2512131 RepID=UPI0010E470A5|nr:HAMP domain-containing sensor histidine kinase [Sphingomonas sp. BK235]TCP36764.1 signal transduction histidine kinase [Sphingomonas sp. BK235]